MMGREKCGEGEKHTTSSVKHGGSNVMAEACMAAWETGALFANANANLNLFS